MGKVKGSTNSKEYEDSIECVVYKATREEHLHTPDFVDGRRSNNSKGGNKKDDTRFGYINVLGRRGGRKISIIDNLRLGTNQEISEDEDDLSSTSLRSGHITQSRRDSEGNWSISHSNMTDRSESTTEQNYTIIGELRRELYEEERETNLNDTNQYETESQSQCNYSTGYRTEKNNRSSHYNMRSLAYTKQSNYNNERYITRNNSKNKFYNFENINENKNLNPYKLNNKHSDMLEKNYQQISFETKNTTTNLNYKDTLDNFYKWETHKKEEEKGRRSCSAREISNTKRKPRESCESEGRS
jgi:hypothetical protein